MDLRVLIIEDEKDISDGVALYLQHLQLETYQAFNGQEALKAFDVFKPNIILLDTLLPDIRGNVLCESFKKTQL